MDFVEENVAGFFTPFDASFILIVTKQLLEASPNVEGVVDGEVENLEGIDSLCDQLGNGVMDEEGFSNSTGPKEDDFSARCFFGEELVKSRGKAVVAPTESGEARFRLTLPTKDSLGGELVGFLRRKLES